MILRLRGLDKISISSFRVIRTTGSHLEKNHQNIVCVDNFLDFRKKKQPAIRFTIVCFDVQIFRFLIVQAKKKLSKTRSVFKLSKVATWR